MSRIRGWFVGRCLPWRTAADHTLREGVRRLRAEPLPVDGLGRAICVIRLRQTTGMAGIVRRAELARMILRQLRFFAKVVLSLVAVYGAYLGWADMEPELNIPAQVLPKENAHDTWERAWRHLKDIESVYIAISTGDQPSYSEAPDRRSLCNEVLDSNEVTLKLIRQGLREPYVLPRTAPIYLSSLPSAHLRELSRLMSLEVMEQRAAGRPDEALSTGLDIIQMGEVTGAHGGTSDRFTGRSTEKMGRNVAWQLLNQVSAGAARSAVERLVALDANHEPLSNAIREDMYRAQSWYMHCFRTAYWRWQSTLHNPQLLITTKRGILAELTSAYEKQISIADQLPPPQTEDDPSDVGPTERAYNSLYRVERFREAAHGIVQNRLLLVSMALRAYRVEHGRYPKRIEDLVPRFLSKIPVDPFGPTKTFGYTVLGEKYTLYSVGPDRIDQGGKAIMKVNDRTNQLASVDMQSMGDIIAGLNRD